MPQPRFRNPPGWTAIRDDLVLEALGPAGWPWETVCDTASYPAGAFETHVRDMVRRGLLEDRGDRVVPRGPPVQCTE